MEEETANTDVNEDNDSVSSTEETNLEDLSKEELVERLNRAEESRKNAVQHMREQEAKHNNVEEPVITQEPIEEDDEIDPSVRELIKQEALAIVKEEQQRERIDRYSQGTTEWLKKQSWSSSLFGESQESDKLFAQYNTELTRLSKEEPVSSPEEYKELMRLAVVKVTRKPDALLDNNSEQNIQQEKASSPGYRGSASVNPENYSKLSDVERTMIDRANELRAKLGQSPIKQSEIFNK